MKRFYPIAFFWMSCMLSFTLFGQSSDTDKKVYVINIKAEIDPRMNRQVSRGFEEAEKAEAELIILHIDTYGGALNDADDIRTMVLNSPVPVYAFIDKDAASAGALISIACDSIYMAPGGSIGAATVVTGDGQAAPDKYQSYMRSIMRSTAEAKGRDPKIAEAMVDERLSIPGITDAGQVLTFSTSEAIANDFCEAQVNDIEEILLNQGITRYEITTYEPDGTEKIIALFLNPFVSGILILIIIGGIYFELQTPGVGFPLAAAITATILYFIPYYLTGLAENWEIVLFLVGIILLAVELLVIPGFGVFGVAGIVAILSSLVLVMVDNKTFDFTFVSGASIFTAILTLLLALLGAMGLLVYAGARFDKIGMFKRIAMAGTQERAAGYTSSYYAADMVGKIGVTHTVLRPSGKVLIDGELYDAYSRGEFIEAGVSITVISTEGTSLKVKQS